MSSSVGIPKDNTTGKTGKTDSSKEELGYRAVKWNCYRLPVLPFCSARKWDTHIMLPHHFVCRRICIHFTFKVHVISFLDVFRVHIRPQLELQRGKICKKTVRKKKVVRTNKCYGQMESDGAVKEKTSVVVAIVCALVEKREKKYNPSDGDMVAEKKVNSGPEISISFS